MRPLVAGTFPTFPPTLPTFDFYFDCVCAALQVAVSILPSLLPLLLLLLLLLLPLDTDVCACHAPTTLATLGSNFALRLCKFLGLKNPLEMRVFLAVFKLKAPQDEGSELLK